MTSPRFPLYAAGRRVKKRREEKERGVSLLFVGLYSTFLRGGQNIAPPSANTVCSTHTLYVREPG